MGIETHILRGSVGSKTRRESEIELEIHGASSILINPREKGRRNNPRTAGQELHLADNVEPVPEQQIVVAVVAATQ